MADRYYALNGERGCLVLSGEDSRGFLQGILSNDIYKVSAERALYAALLTAQGRFLHDLFIAEAGGEPHAGGLILDGEAARLDDLKRRLAMYKLRAKVSIADVRAALSVVVLWGAGILDALELAPEPGRARPFGGGIAFVDPRLAALGARAILPTDTARDALAKVGIAEAHAVEHRWLRLSLGVAEGGSDLEVEKALLLENGFEELNGVDFKKGCYVGQEVTARMKYRTLVKRRLLPVVIDGPPPDPGAPITLGVEEVGEMRTNLDGIGLALLKLGAVDEAAITGKPLNAGHAILHPRKPAWFPF